MDSGASLLDDSQADRHAAVKFQSLSACHFVILSACLLFYGWWKLHQLQEADHAHSPACLPPVPVLPILLNRLLLAVEHYAV